MSEKISIAIDAMGGDNAPDKTIEGIKIFLDRNKNNNDFLLNIFGKEEEISKRINKLKISTNLIKIINSEKVVSDEETPMTAVKIQKHKYGIVFSIS